MFVESLAHNSFDQALRAGGGNSRLSGAAPVDSSCLPSGLNSAPSMSTVEFDGTPKDPVPPDLVLELGQKQDTAIKGLASGLGRC